jgi:hypothetical protein
MPQGLPAGRNGILHPAMLMLVWICVTSCHEDPPQPPRDNTIWFPSLPSDFTTDTKAQISIQWSSIINGQNDQIVYLDLYQAGTVWKSLTTTRVDLRAPGSSQFVWDGRMPAASQTAGRRMPVPPGNYDFRMQAGTSTILISTRAVRIVANEWDTDSDGSSDYVENENDATSGTFDPQTWIYYDNNLHFTTYDATNVDLPLVIPVSDQGHPNRGTHDYTVAYGQPGGTPPPQADGLLGNGLRIANFGPGYFDKNWNLIVPNPNYIHDQHNWGTLELINLVERVAREIVPFSVGNLRAMLL